MAAVDGMNRGFTLRRSRTIPSSRRHCDC